ncbi:hypothetical protein [Streptomyces bambusae]
MSGITTADGVFGIRDRILAVMGAARLLRAFAALGAGPHELSVTLVATDDGVETEKCMLNGPAIEEEDPSRAVTRTGMLLARTARDGAAMAVLSTPEADGTVTVRAWAVFELVPLPADAHAALRAHCMNQDRDPDDPAPGHRFVNAPDLD